MRDTGHQAPARDPLTQRGLPRFTAISVLIHAVGTLAVSFMVSAPQKPVFAEPIYTVAFYQADKPKTAPPKPVKRRLQEEQKKPPPQPKTEEIKPVETPVKQKKAEKPKPKPPVEKKQEPVKEPPLKPPVKRSEAVTEDQVKNTETEVDQVSMGLVDQKDFRHNYYLERVRALLASKWRAPSGKGGVQKVTVHFFIDRDGSARGIEVREESGSSLYDRTALGTVHSVDRFPPLPQSYEGDRIGISVVFQTVRGGEE